MASRSSWDSQDFHDVNMVLKMVRFHKSSRPQWVNWWVDTRHATSHYLNQWRLSCLTHMVSLGHGEFMKPRITWTRLAFLYIVSHGLNWLYLIDPFQTTEPVHHNFIPLLWLADIWGRYQVQFTVYNTPTIRIFIWNFISHTPFSFAN